MDSSAGHQVVATSHIPFDTDKLDRLMDEAGLDLLLVTSKHNVQYLLDVERAMFFDYMDAIGISRYLPIVVYPKGKPGKAVFIGHRLEIHQRVVAPPWTPVVKASSQGSVDAITMAIEEIKRSGVPVRSIGVEAAFLPMDAASALRSELPSSEIKDAWFVLERLRAVKTPAELRKLRKASELVVESMLEVLAHHDEGRTKRQIVDALRTAEVSRGLTFEYCLIACGDSHNRAATDVIWRKDEVLSLDSGGNFEGYIGDVARMAILGEPDSELRDLLAEIDYVQNKAFAEVRAGAPGANIYAAAEKALRESRSSNCTEFLAHGMGLVSHEAPRLTASGPVVYDSYDAGRPLEAGMVLSIETTMQHPRRGFIKLEDTVAVTATGYEMFGEGGRGWNVGALER